MNADVDKQETEQRVLVVGLHGTSYNLFMLALILFSLIITLPAVIWPESMAQCGTRPFRSHLGADAGDLSIGSQPGDILDWRHLGLVFGVLVIIDVILERTQAGRKAKEVASVPDASRGQ